MDPKLKAIISFVIPSVVLLCASIPLILEKIPPNRGYGFRVKKTLADECIWYKANRYGGICFLFSSLTTLAVCLFFFVNKAGFSADQINLIGFAFFVVPIAGALVLTLAYIKRL